MFNGFVERRAGEEEWEGQERENLRTSPSLKPSPSHSPKLLLPAPARRGARTAHRLAGKLARPLAHASRALALGLTSSASPCWRILPQRAMVVPWPLMALPSASTSATVIWIDAWSLAVMRRSGVSVCGLGGGRWMGAVENGLGGRSRMRKSLNMAIERFGEMSGGMLGERWAMLGGRRRRGRRVGRVAVKVAVEEMRREDLKGRRRPGEIAERTGRARRGKAGNDDSTVLAGIVPVFVPVPSPLFAHPPLTILRPSRALSASHSSLRILQSLACSRYPRRRPSRIHRRVGRRARRVESSPPHSSPPYHAPIPIRDSLVAAQWRGM